MGEGAMNQRGNIPQELKKSAPALVARTLVKQYKHAPAPALNRLNLQVETGDFFGLLGPNGAGKTTAISLFSGLLTANSGTISILGSEFKKFPQQLRRLIGLVPQEIALYEKLTARENLLYFGKLADLGGKELQLRIEYCLDFSGLGNKATQLVSTFSGGMKRRLNLVAGLLHSPKILFLDEPTVGVDTQSRHLIHKQLQELNRNQVTIVYTSHYLEEAQELCNTIAIIDEGRIISQGSPADLLRQNNCHNLEKLFLQLTGRQVRD